MLNEYAEWQSDLPVFKYRYEDLVGRAKSDKGSWNEGGLTLASTNATTDDLETYA
jgi:hypothetical protein